VGQVNTAFMNSPDHRANILGDYTAMGTGAWAATGPWSGAGGSYNGVIMYTEIFIKGIDEPSYPCGANPPPGAPPYMPPSPSPSAAPSPVPTPGPSTSPKP